MAEFFKKNAFTMIVLSIYFLVGCDKKLTPTPVRVGSAVGQSICGIDAYDPKSDSCSSSLTKPKEVSNVDNVAIIALVATSKKDLIVVDTAIAKKGQGCIAMTRNTKMPLSKNDCRKLFSEHKRKIPVFISVQGSFTYFDPFVITGEEWYLLQSSKNVNGVEKIKMYWKIPNT